MDRQTDRRTFVILESLLRLKIQNFLKIWLKIFIAIVSNPKGSGLRKQSLNVFR